MSSESCKSQMAKGVSALYRMAEDADVSGRILIQVTKFVNVHNQSEREKIDNHSAKKVIGCL
jgi:hypothetical protein